VSLPFKIKGMWVKLKLMKKYVLKTMRH